MGPSEWKSRQGELKRQAAARKKQVWFDGKNGEIEEKIKAELQVFEDMIPDPHAEAVKKNQNRKLPRKEEELLLAKSEERKAEIELKKKKLRKKYHPGNEALEKEYLEDVLGEGGSLRSLKNIDF